MASAQGFHGWYPCVETLFRLSIDWRMQQWISMMQDSLPKLAWDGDWILNGGTVGDADYVTALRCMSSTIQTVSVGGTPVDFVVTPVSFLTSYTEVWLEEQSEPTDCFYIRDI